MIFLKTAYRTFLWDFTDLCAQSQVDSDWLSLFFFLFITWRKSESDSKYIVPLCHYSCAEVDFPFLITLQRLYTYRYSYPWCERPFTLESVTIYLTFEDREMQNRKPEVELERSDYRTLRARSANICRSSPLISTALSAFFYLSVCFLISFTAQEHTGLARCDYTSFIFQAGRLWPHYITRLGFHLGSVCSSALLRRFLVRGRRLDKSVI